MSWPGTESFAVLVINALDVCLVNVLLHGRLINSIEVWAVRRPKIQRNKVWQLSIYIQQFDSFTNAM